jgi:alpha-L-fucosidase
MNGGRAYDSDVNQPEYADFYAPAVALDGTDLDWHSLDWQPRPNAKFLEDWLARNTELVEKYQPQLVYFDWWVEQIIFAPYIQRFAAYYYNKGLDWNLGVAINAKDRGFPEETMVRTVERGQLKDLRPLFWQTDTSISNNSWCYIEDQDYKTAPYIIHTLIDSVSKNGAMLLNIGPRADGTIAEAEQAILREVGRWLAVNGEAIYGTRHWKIFGEGPTQVSEGKFQEKESVPFTGKDIRFTTKGETLYAIALGAPQNGEVLIESLGANRDLYSSSMTRVELLGSNAQLEWKRGDDGLRVTLPPDVLLEPAYVLKIE